MAEARGIAVGFDVGECIRRAVKAERGEPPRDDGPEFAELRIWFGSTRKDVADAR